MSNPEWTYDEYGQAVIKNHHAMRSKILLKYTNAVHQTKEGNMEEMEQRRMQSNGTHWQIKNSDIDWTQESGVEQE